MKYIVWLKFTGRAAEFHDEPADKWVPNRDGPMGLKTAERVARELATDFQIKTKVMPEGEEPR